MLAVNEGRIQWKENAVVVNLATSLIMVYVTINLMNAHIWSIHFNAVDYLIKPFVIFPFAFLVLTAIQIWTNSLVQRMKAQIHIKSAEDRTNMKTQNLVVLYLISSLVITYSAVSISNIYIIGAGFDPIEILLKPMLLSPVTFLLLILFANRTRYANNRLISFVNPLFEKYSTAFLVLNNRLINDKRREKPELSSSITLRGGIDQNNIELKRTIVDKKNCWIRGPTRGRLL